MLRQFQKVVLVLGALILTACEKEQVCVDTGAFISGAIIACGLPEGVVEGDFPLKGPEWVKASGCFATKAEYQDQHPIIQVSPSLKRAQIQWFDSQGILAYSEEFPVTEPSPYGTYLLLQFEPYPSDHIDRWDWVQAKEEWRSLPPEEWSDITFDLVDEGLKGYERFSRTSGARITKGEKLDPFVRMNADKFMAMFFNDGRVEADDVVSDRYENTPARIRDNFYHFSVKGDGDYGCNTVEYGADIVQ